MKLFLPLSLFLLSFAGFAKLADHVPGEIVVTYKDSFSTYSLKSEKSLGINEARAFHALGKRMEVLTIDSIVSIEEVIKEMKKNPSVLHAEPNFIYTIGNNKVQEITDLNDPKFNELWGLRNTGNNEPGSSKTGVEGADINAFKAWEITKGSRDVVIAVIDTGVDYTHKDLAANMWVNEAEKNGEAGVDDDGNGYIDDIHGYDFANNDADPIDDHNHGTHCAGTIAAVHNNNEGVAGVMANAKIMALKFLTARGSGTLEGAVKSIDYATNANADLMSNSWGGGGFSEQLKDAIVRASEKGIIFTAAAGNSATNNDSKAHYPSNYDVPNVVSVAAHNAQNTLASFSCYGKRTVHIAAPGRNILSTLKDNKYGVYSGTSMATPHVSGALGLLLAKEGRMSHEEMRERLMLTSVPVASLKSKIIKGGRLDAFNLLTDTRPERTEPDAGKWVRVNFDTPFESEHPYGHNQTLKKVVKAPEGTKYMRVFVEKLELETKYDFVSIKKEGARDVVEKMDGAKENYLSEYIEGSSLEMVFTSDRSVSKWGFKITGYEYQ